MSDTDRETMTKAFPGETLETEQPDTLTIVLRKPVTFATIVYDHLNLREPTGHEWEMWAKLDRVPAIEKAISIIAGIPEGAVRQIGVRDILAAENFILGFF